MGVTVGSVRFSVAGVAAGAAPSAWPLRGGVAPGGGGPGGAPRGGGPPPGAPPRNGNAR